MLSESLGDCVSRARFVFATSAVVERGRRVPRKAFLTRHSFLVLMPITWAMAVFLEFSQTFNRRWWSIRRPVTKFVFWIQPAANFLDQRGDKPYK